MRALAVTMGLRFVSGNKPNFVALPKGENDECR